MATKFSLKASEISSLIKERIESYEQEIVVRNEGRIISLSDGVVLIHGLANVQYGEKLAFEGGEFGIALNLEQDSVGAVILGDAGSLKEGQIVRCTEQVLSVPVGPELLGRVVDSLGRPIDGLGEIVLSETSPIEKVAPGVIWRQSVSVSLATGIKAIDSMVPIGRGQRELIIGDRQTGKTAIAIDTIINQKNTGVKCIYVAIGQKASTISTVVRRLEQYNALSHTVIVAAPASYSAALQ